MVTDPALEGPKTHGSYGPGFGTLTLKGEKLKKEDENRRQ
jgi:hypothetical protein